MRLNHERSDDHSNRAEQTTIVTAPTGELSPIEAAIMDACNELHEVRKLDDQAAGAKIRQRLFLLIGKYDETDGENHPNPAWARPNQRALALSASGEILRAIDTERMALKYADTDRRLEISLDNLCDRCMRVGRYEEAIAYFLRANDVAPQSVAVLLNGAMALWLGGYHKQAESIFAALCHQPEQLAPNGTLAAYLACESRLTTMRADLPALDHLFKMHEERNQAWRGRAGGAS
ncbi:MAG: tetratricopeptide (TPR) repeat protein [Phycisphaerales bacterium]|jgi:tetratricopeptide (TPR) repeat protein